MSPFQLADEVALVTGGGTGLGLGIARSMVRAGARVVLVGRRQEVLTRAVDALGPAASYELHDVTRVAEAASLSRRVEERVGPISILVNNAGVHLKKPAMETTEEEFLQVFNTHVMGAFALTRAVAPGMVERRRGSILFIASMASLFGIPQVVAYTAAKTAYVGLVNALTVELSPHGVRVNAIAPGWIDTDMLRRAIAGDSERESKILSRTPMNRFGTPEDVGQAAVYLCSPAAQFVTGVVLPVDGGASIGF
jgi:gluconate 5-dehydrogenase